MAEYTSPLPSNFSCLLLASYRTCFSGIYHIIDVLSILYPQYLLPPPQKEGRYGMRASQTFLILTRFVEKACNIFISK